MKSNHLLSYEAGSSFLHRIDARIKLFFTFALGFAAFSLSPFACAVLFSALFFTGIVAGFSIRSQLAALRVVFRYALLLYAAQLLGAAFDFIHGVFWNEIVSTDDFFSALIPERRVVSIILRLSLALEGAGIVYRTTSPLSMREAVENIERRVMCAFGKKTDGGEFGFFSKSFSLLFVMLPLVFSAWQEIALAWRARRGKGGVTMLRALLPVFLSLCMKRAWEIDRAMRARTDERAQ